MGADQFHMDYDFDRGNQFVLPACRSLGWCSLPEDMCDHRLLRHTSHMRYELGTTDGKETQFFMELHELLKYFIMSHALFSNALNSPHNGRCLRGAELLEMGAQYLENTRGHFSIVGAPAPI